MELVAVHPNEIQPADWRDWLGVIALEKACFGPDAWDVLELFWVLVRPGIRLKAVSDRRLIGFVVGEAHPAEGCSWIATIGVLPEFQGQGLGARLLAEAESRLPLPVIKLTVRESNARAIALYKRSGYAATQTIPRYYAGGETGMVMEKRLKVPGSD
jgi:ribosomal-protein-alanine N-acetyltransferase